MEKVQTVESVDRAKSRVIADHMRSFALLAGIFGFGSGSLVLLGWQFNVPTLKGILPGFALMQPNTALGVALAGVALFALRCEPMRTRARWLGAGFAAVVAAIGLLTLTEHAFGADLQIDLFLFGRAPGTEGPASPGRMSLVTSIGLSCLGTALVLIARRGRGVRVAQVLTLVTVLLALLDLIGYSYGVRFLDFIGPYSTMALHTALALLVLGLGTLAARPSLGLLRRLTADDAGGWLLRNVLPVAIVLPLSLGGLRVAAEEAGLFNNRFGSAVLILAYIVTLASLLWWTAGHLARLDVEKRQAERSAEERAEWLRATLTSVGDALIATDVAGRVTFMNSVAEALTGSTQADAVGEPLAAVFRTVDEATRGPVENPALRALRAGTFVRLANHPLLIARNGKERPIDDSAAPIRRDDGSIAGAVLVFRDVSERRRQRHQLEDALSRLDSILTASEIGTWEFDAVANVVRGDANFARMFGVGPEVAAGGPIERYVEAIHPDDRARVAQAFERALERGGDYEAEYRLDGVSEVARRVVARGRARRDGAGNVIGLPGVVVDITVQKRAEEELRETRSRLESTLSAAEVGTWEFDVVANVVHADRNLARMFGVDPEAAVGGPLDAYTQAIHPDDRPRVEAAIGRALANDESYETEYRLVGPEGSIRWVVARGRVERGDQGQDIRMPGVVVDITARKQAEEEHARLVAASEQQRRTFETALSNTPDFNYTFDLDGRFTFVNAALLNLWQKDLSEAVGKNFAELGYPPDLADRLRDQIRAVIATGRSIRDETPFTSHLGGRLYEYILAPVLGADGTIEAVAGSTRDITERKQMEQELRRIAADLSEADRRKDEFLATLAHELRNPLAPIRNSLQIMKLADEDAQSMTEARNLMERQVTHMVRLIDDLMDVSRITRGKLDLRKGRIELASAIQNAVDTSRPLIAAAGHDLTVTLPETPILVDADETRLAQVFANLLNNAAKYTERGGTITLDAERQGDAVVVTVRDNGVGIPPEMLPEVFALFTQIDRSLERSQGGLGIGLSLVKTLVEMHGGTVEARSAGQGQGCAFVVRLPTVLAASAQSPGSAADGGAVGGVASLRILVVDDNRDAARTLARLLKLSGHETRTAHDGGEAIEVAEAYRPEVMFLDIGLPVLNGYDVARRIRSRPWGRDPVIVALTGWGQDGDRRNSQEAGIDQHLVKPVDPADVEQLLAGLRPTPAPDPVPA